MQLTDTGRGYGWISIGLHWASAPLILWIWFLGRSIPGAGAHYASALQSHTTLALCALVLLAPRIVWRFRKRHPDPLPRQAGLTFKLGVLVHYAILAAVALMLTTGPLMLIARGTPVSFFGAVLQSPFAPMPLLARGLHSVHVWSGWFIFGSVVLHIAGVFKDVAFKRDGTFGRMLEAAPPQQAESPVRPTLMPAESQAQQ